MQTNFMTFNANIEFGFALKFDNMMMEITKWRHEIGGGGGGCRGRVYVSILCGWIVEIQM